MVARRDHGESSKPSSEATACCKWDSAKSSLAVLFMDDIKALRTFWTLRCRETPLDNFEGGVRKPLGPVAVGTGRITRSRQFFYRNIVTNYLQCMS